MKLGKGRGTEVGNNVQPAVDSKPKLIMAHDATNAPGDRAWLSPMALQAQAGLGCTCDAVADVGYDHGEEGKTCLAAGIPPYVTRPSTSATQTLGLFSKDDCTYERATDTYQCPAGAPLTFRFAPVELGRHLRYYATSACRAWPLKQWWEQGFFLMRGWEKVRTELSLTVLAYTLRRGLNLVGVPRLIAALG